MSSQHFGLIDDYVLGQAPSAADLNRRAKVLDVQLSGALSTLGRGVLAGLAVTQSGGGSVVVAPGEAIARHSSYGALYMRQPTEQTFSDFEHDADNYLFAAVRTGSVGSPDTRFDGLPAFFAGTASTLDGGVLLAKVTLTGSAITSVTDLRHMAGETAFLASWFGNGRRIRANPVIGSPTIVAASLNIALPAGSKYFYAGRDIVLQNAQFITVPESSTVWPVLVFDDDDIVSATFPITQPPAGTGSIGRVISDATHVLSVNDDKSADLIPDLSALYNLAKAIGSSDDGTIDLAGYVTIETFNALLGRVTELENSLNLGIPVVQNDYERIDSELGGVTLDLIDINPLHAITTPGSVLLDGTTGNSEHRPPNSQMPQTSAGGNEMRGDA